MKNPDTSLHTSDRLAPFVAKYRDEPPLVSAPELADMLARRDPLRYRPSKTKKSIMTLAGLSALSFILYQLFGGAPQPIAQHPRAEALSGTLHPHHHAVAAALSQLTRDEHKAEEHRTSSSLLAPNNDDRPPFAAPGDQIFADLTPSQLARLGIIVMGDTIAQYNLNRKGDATMMKLTVHSFEGEERSDVPKGITVSNLSPVIMTQADGHGAAFHREDSLGGFTWGMTGDDQKHREEALKYIKRDNSHGFHLLGFNVVVFDSKSDILHPSAPKSVSIEIGQDIGSLPFHEVRKPSWGMPDSLFNSLKEYADYYMGKIPKPYSNIPGYSVRADTLTMMEIVERYDQEDNAKNKPMIREVLSRLNELIPVLVRLDSKSGKPSPKDYIFWYEPSEDLFNALPPAQASLFRHSASPDHCLTAPNSVSNDATITYCSSEAQPVSAIVRDLTGHIIRIVLADAHLGDNTLTIPTEVLASGMYIVTIRTKNSPERSRRIWVENHAPLPFPLPERGPESVTSYEDHTSIFTFPADCTPDQAALFVARESQIVSSYADWGKKLPAGRSNAITRGNRSYKIERDAGLDSAMSDLNSDFTKIASSVAYIKGLHVSAGLDYIELDHKDESRLGLESNDSLVKFFVGDTSTYVALGVMRSWGVQTGDYIQPFKPGHSPHIVRDLTPSFVTDGIGRKRLIVTTSSDDSTINSLVPVLFRAPMPADTLGARDIIFWYKPTPTFLAALPDSIREIITGSHSQVRSQTPSALRSVRVYPNPSRGDFALDLTFDTPRKLSVIVRNLIGQERARMLLSVPSGTSSERISFNTLEDGIYILELTSDAAETSFERIVIEH
jgi:hypothetical protein